MPFILDGLETETYDRSYTDRQLLRRIASYFKPYVRQMVFVATMMTLNSLAGTAGPILISKAIDRVTVDPSATVIVMMAMGVLLLGAAAWGFSFLRQWVSAQVVGDVVLKLRQDVFDAAVHNDLSFYDEHSSGKIVSRVTSDTQDFSNVVTLVVDVLSQFLLVILLLGWLFSIEVKLTLLVLSLSPVVFIIALSFRKIARKVTRNSRKVTAKINAHIQESISGIMIAKSFRQEKSIYQGFSKNNKQAYRVGLTRGITMNIIFPVMNLTSGIAMGVVAYLSGLATRGNGISPGDWYLFMQSVWFFWWPLSSIASFWSQFQDGLSAAERVFALIDAPPKVQQIENTAIPTMDGVVEFRNVSFSYVEAEPVLRDFSLTVSAGETLAIVGQTGAGKSSIVKVIDRFYEFQEGQILVDGRDIRTLNLFDYRRHVGMVPQTPYLFNGTIRDNITYGLPDAREQSIINAAMRISRGDWLEQLPDGLDTDVGTRGSSLSMGQRQLVALARVLLKDPSIFILDEATASVDPFTETQIQEGLETVMETRTAIVIAHRLSTVKNADRIIVLDHGAIVEEGTHEALLAKQGSYADLYNTYFRHQSLEYVNQKIV